MACIVLPDPQTADLHYNRHTATTLLLHIKECTIHAPPASLPSNVNRLPLVPTTPLTVTTACDWLLSVVGTPERHCTAVPDDHDAVLHSSDPDTSPADGVNPKAPKLSPVIVTELDPLAAPFRGRV